MKSRIVSIDLLRSIAIVGMVLCATIGWNSNLPAWMFHAQVPPPDYVFNPLQPGITWVDLVFPFFIFSMGAALPLSLGGRIKKGESTGSIILGVLHRWLSLVIFSILLGNTSAVSSSSLSQNLIYLYNIFVWISFFMIFLRVPQSIKRYGVLLRVTGLVLMFSALLLAKCFFEVPISIHNNDIIILILSHLVLWGSLIWLITRNSPYVRSMIFLIIIAFKLLADLLPQSLSWVPAIDSMHWLFSWSFLQYLIIVIPALSLGESLLKSSSIPRQKQKLDSSSILSFILLIFVSVFQLWGLFVREVSIDLIVTLISAALFFYINKANDSSWVRIAYAGLVFTIIGVAMDPVNGGIAKDPCNFSYLMTTGGIAMLVLSVLFRLENSGYLQSSLLAGVGQNPMIAYTLNPFLISPVLYLTGLMSRLDQLTVHNMFWGTFRGLFITVLMVVITSFFTRRKVFWRS